MRRSRDYACVPAVLGLALATPAMAQVPPAACGTKGEHLKAASPDWRDQVIYFLMLDRFADGDRRNNDQGQGEYRPADNGGWSGGDLQGVRDRLDYIQGLGATAVWTTPPVANQWWSKESGFGGYHGYWARDFTKVDEHYGTLADLQGLSCDLHRRDMRHVMDIVVNHVGDFFEYDRARLSADPATGYTRVNPGSPTDAPVNAPFDLNDPRRAADRAAGIYNWTPELLDYGNRKGELTQQLARLDDINTESPAVRRAFKSIYGDWIDKAGFDAFRVDTVKYVEPDFFSDFLYAPDGIVARAQRSGRDDFLVFGEVKETSPEGTVGEEKLQVYFSRPGRPMFDSLINFPLQEEMVRVLAQGRPTADLRYRLDAFMRIHPDPLRATNFVDNHDMPRFLSQGSVPAFKQAMAMIFTLPGIPMIYQGDEQAMHESRQTMFAGGYGTTRDGYDTQSEMYRYIARLAAVRRDHGPLRRGGLTVLADNPALPGAFAYRRDEGGRTVFVVLNSADTPSLLAEMPTGLPPGTVLRSLVDPAQVRTSARDGSLTLELPPRAVMVFAPQEPPAASVAAAGTRSIVIDTPAPTAPLVAPLTIEGRYAGPAKTLRLVTDGDLSRALAVPVGPDGRWRAVLAAGDLGTYRRTARLFAPGAGEVSDAIAYTTRRDSAEREVTVRDPAGDDDGRAGRAAPPQDASFRGQLDLLGARARIGGDVLELELRMRAVTSGWFPANGFDHVAFTTFFDLPGKPGLARSDAIRSPMPAGFDWSAVHSVFGWGNTLSLAPDAKLGEAPAVRVDKDRGTVTIAYRASRLGIPDWRGVRLWVTTFDKEGEGEWRGVTRAGGPMRFRGDPDGPRIVDEMLIKLP